MADIMLEIIKNNQSLFVVMQLKIAIFALFAIVLALFVIEMVTKDGHGCMIAQPYWSGEARPFAIHSYGQFPNEKFITLNITNFEANYVLLRNISLVESKTGIVSVFALPPEDEQYGMVMEPGKKNEVKVQLSNVCARGQKLEYSVNLSYDSTNEPWGGKLDFASNEILIEKNQTQFGAKTLALACGETYDFSASFSASLNSPKCRQKGLVNGFLWDTFKIVLF